MYYRVFELRDGHVPLVVYCGDIDQEIMSGFQTLQIRSFGRRYHVDGRVFEDQGDTTLPGLRCRFDEVE